MPGSTVRRKNRGQFRRPTGGIPFAGDAQHLQKRAISTFGKTIGSGMERSGARLAYFCQSAHLLEEGRLEISPLVRMDLEG